MSGQRLTLAEQETSSSRASYPSLPRDAGKLTHSAAPPLPTKSADFAGSPAGWDNELDTAEVYTHDARLTGKLRELSQRFPEDYVLERSGPGRSMTYRIPKQCMGIRPPYSEERR